MSALAVTRSGYDRTPGTDMSVETHDPLWRVRCLPVPDCYEKSGTNIGHAATRRDLPSLLAGIEKAAGELQEEVASLAA